MKGGAGGALWLVLGKWVVLLSGNDREDERRNQQEKVLLCFLRARIKFKYSTSYNVRTYLQNSNITRLIM